MRIYWALFPLLSGCLLNFSAFTEKEFLQSYENTLCDLYVDCLDGNADNQRDVADSNIYWETCVTHVNTPANENCVIVEDRAYLCYEEVLILADSLHNGGSCETLWDSNILPNCKGTYLNCATDNRFGTFPSNEVGAHDPPTVTHIDVRNGPSTGGTEIVITGTGFDEHTQVQFGGNFGTVLGIDDDGTVMYVLSPPGSVGTQQFNVTNNYGNTILDFEDFKFTYWESLNHNATGILGWYGYYRMVGGSWAHPDSEVHGQLRFVSEMTPNLASFEALVGVGMNQCLTLSNQQSGILFKEIKTSYTNVMLQPGSGTEPIVFENIGDYFEVSEGGPTAEDTRYTLSAEGFDGWPSLAISNVFQAPTHIQVKHPYLNSPEMSPPKFDRSQLEWVPSGDDSYIYAKFESLTSEEDAIVCRFADSGDVDLRLYPNFQLGEGDPLLIGVQLCRFTTRSEGSSPINNGVVSLYVGDCTRGIAELLP